MTSPTGKPLAASATSYASAASASENNRNKSVATRLTDAEFAEVESAAASTGKKVAEWLRDVALTHARATGRRRLFL
jgi:hypothetical protein